MTVVGFYCFIMDYNCCIPNAGLVKPKARECDIVCFSARRNEEKKNKGSVDLNRLETQKIIGKCQKVLMSQWRI